MATAATTRQPKGGYSFEAKDEYRRRVWSYFADHLDDVKKAKVLFLPSREGLEIPIALEYGFKEENLIAVDDSPAQIAVSKWRRLYPKVKFYGNELSRAADRIVEDKISIDAANLDLCGNISSPMIKSIEGFFQSRCLSGRALVSITMLKGRELHAINTLADLYLKTQKLYGPVLNFDKRLQVMVSIIKNAWPFNECGIQYCLDGEYRSRGKQHMVYGLFEFMTRDCAIDIFKKLEPFLITKIKPYIKVKREHRDFKYYNKHNNYHYPKTLFGKKQHSYLLVNYDTMLQVNDIYRAWLEKTKEQLKDMVEDVLFKKIIGRELENHVLWYMYHSSKNSMEWLDFFDNQDFFYDGVKRIFPYYRAKNQAIGYLNKISWDIRR